MAILDACFTATCRDDNRRNIILEDLSAATCTLRHISTHCVTFWMIPQKNARGICRSSAEHYR
jgi:hypothetical protein